MLFPDNRPYKSFMLPRTGGHALNVELLGNPFAKPIVVLHGGPGAGIEELFYYLFNPTKWHVILIDQRGCGKSSPKGSLTENTTTDLIEDIEAVRRFLNIDSWTVTGGSWGVALALAYAIRFPNRVNALILRAVFLATNDELDWLYGGKGTGRLMPEAYARFVSVPGSHASFTDTIKSYREGVISVKSHIARAWALFEAETAQTTPLEVDDPSGWWNDSNYAQTIAKIETHYFLNNCFLPDDYILSNINIIKDIPGTIVHGVKDAMCSIEVARLLARHWTKGKLIEVSEGGHSIGELPMLHALVGAFKEFEDKLIC